MGIAIHITDPSSIEKQELIRLIAFLSVYAGFDPQQQYKAPQIIGTPLDQQRIPTDTNGQDAWGNVPSNPFAAQHKTGTPITPPLPSPPVPVPPVPTPSAVEHVWPASQPPGIDVDKSGLPWDGRIHASTRAKNADGTWRGRRNVDDAVVASVTAELRQTMGVLPAPVMVPPSGVVVPPAPFVPSVVPSVPQATAVSIPAPPPVTLAGAATTASPSNPTFPQLMKKITEGYTAKTLTQSDIAVAVQSAGLPSLPMLASRPDLIPSVATALGLTL